MIENLKDINKFGIHRFLKNETDKWKCSSCGGIICVHNRKCCNCNIVIP